MDGHGGDEAALFAQDLLRMYLRYAERRGWKAEIMDSNTTDIGGIKEASVLIKGKGAYSRLKYESGTHRVQRVPDTESAGRVHTSAATVAVLPEVDDVEVEINPNDVRVDVYRSSGNGGQCVNTTDSAVRLTHIPTGLVVTCQDEKSQIKNKEKAMSILKGKLLLLEIEANEKELASIRGDSMNIDFGSQIRSYVMHPYSMVKDHRTGISTSDVSKVLDGDIDMFIEAYLRS